MKIPSYIQVTTPPATVTYDDGDTIDYTGMVVTRYDANGQSMGTVPISELTLPDTVADSTELTRLAEYAGSSLDISPLPNPLEIASSGYCYVEYSVMGIHYYEKYTFTPVPGKNVMFITCYMDEGDSLMRPFYASDTPGEMGMVHHERYGIRPDGSRVHESEENTFISTEFSWTTDGKTVYYHDGRSGTIGNRDSFVKCNYPIHLWPNNTSNSNYVAWTMIYGTRTTDGYEVRVWWPRTGDGKVLETSFGININDN